MNIETVYLNSRLVSQVRGNAILVGSMPKRAGIEGHDVGHHDHYHGASMRLRSLEKDHSDCPHCMDDGNSSPQQIR